MKQFIPVEKKEDIEEGDYYVIGYYGRPRKGFGSMSFYSKGKWQIELSCGGTKVTHFATDVPRQRDGYADWTAIAKFAKKKLLKK